MITHGDGDDRGDGSEIEDIGSTQYLQSYAPSDASRFAGDPDDFGDNARIFMQPRWTNDVECSAGQWGEHTSGDAVAAAESSFQGGTYGLLSANWGGKWKDARLNDHMNQDLKRSPCQVVCLQEAEESLAMELENLPVHSTGGGKGAERPRSKFISFRGPESKASLMICARQFLVSGIRVWCFIGS